MKNVKFIVRALIVFVSFLISGQAVSAQEVAQEEAMQPLRLKMLHKAKLIPFTNCLMPRLAVRERLLILCLQVKPYQAMITLP